jgi:hypothetical protein
MNKTEAQKLKRKAIKTLRSTGMSDEDISAELGTEVIIDAEIVDEVHLSAEEPTEPRPLRPLSLPVPVCRRDWSKYSDPQRRCKAHKKNGERCKNPARRGTVVCDKHGAKAPQVLAKARERLQMASNRMVGNLFQLADDAESEAVRLGATNSALDRAGLKAATQVEIGVKPYEEVWDSIAGGSRAESRGRRGFPDEPTESQDYLADETLAPGGTSAFSYEDEPLSEPESEDIDGGHEKYHVRHIVGDEAIETANRLRFGEIERG